MRLRIAVLMITTMAAALTGAPSASASSTPTFADVAADAYYADAVRWLAAQDITTGTSATTFSPDDVVTRGQMAAFLARLADADLPAAGCHDMPSRFEDLDPCRFDWHPVTWLADRLLTTGTSSTTFSPDDPVTRGQLATFLWRYLGAPVTTEPFPFTDIPAGAYYADAVRWLFVHGVTTGTSSTRFSPHLPVTRGQMATLLWRMVGEPTPSDPGVERQPAYGIPSTTSVFYREIANGIAVSTDGFTGTVYARARFLTEAGHPPLTEENLATGEALFEGESLEDAPIEITFGGTGVPESFSVGQPMGSAVRIHVDWQLGEDGWHQVHDDEPDPAVVAPAVDHSEHGATYVRYVLASSLVSVPTVTVDLPDEEPDKGTPLG